MRSAIRYCATYLALQASHRHYFGAVIQQQWDRARGCAGGVSCANASSSCVEATNAHTQHAPTPPPPPTRNAGPPPPPLPSAAAAWPLTVSDSEAGAAVVRAGGGPLLTPPAAAATSTPPLPPCAASASAATTAAASETRMPTQDGWMRCPQTWPRVSGERRRNESVASARALCRRAREKNMPLA